MANSKNGKRKAEKTSSAAELQVPDAGRCNFTALRKAARRISQLYDAVLAPCGLRSTQWSILIHIARAGNPTLSQLAESLALDPSALTHNLKPLKRDGFIEDYSDSKDKRSRIVKLTPSGREKVIESLYLWESAQKNIETIIGKQEAKLLRVSLDFLSSKAFTHTFDILRKKVNRRK